MLAMKAIGEALLALVQKSDELLIGDFLAAVRFGTGQGQLFRCHRMPHVLQETTIAKGVFTRQRDGKDGVAAVYNGCNFVRGRRLWRRDMLLLLLLGEGCFRVGDVYDL
jgi:hypothetical protein